MNSGIAAEESGRAPRWLSRYAVECAFLCLFALTVAAVALQDRLLVRTRSFSPAEAAKLVSYTYGDADSGGSSIARNDPRRPLAWSCRLTTSFRDRYCGYELLIDPLRYADGIDLTGYDRLTLRLAYAGPGERLSVYLKNHDPRYSVAGRSETNKFNRVDFVAHGDGKYELNLADFAVAEWWLAAHRVRPELSQPQLDNVASIAVQTGIDAPPGDYHFRIEGISFTGTLATPEHFYLGLLALWGLCLSFFLVWRFRSQQRAWRSRAVASAEAEQAMRTSHDRAYALLDSIPQIIWECDAAGLFTYLSRQWYEFTGTERTGRPFHSFLECIHPDDWPPTMARWKASLSTGIPFEAEYRLMHRDGGYRWCLARAVPQRRDDGRITGWYGSCTDVHARIVAQHALQESEALNRSIFEASPDCIALMDLDGAILDLNEAAEQSGRLRRRFGGRRFAAGGRRDGAREAFAAARDGRIGRFTHQERGSSGKWWDVLIAPLLDASGRPAKLVSIARDITQQKQAEARAYWVANHDPLTRLPNRTLMQETLERAVEEASRGAAGFALLLIDVDDFKRVNDTFGHDGGDALLCAFAERLKSSLGPADHVFRLGGDEFALLLGGVDGGEAIDRFAERLYKALAEPCLHAGRMLDLRASIGAALWGDHGRSRSELMKNADIALYAAKAAGRKTLRLFQASMRDEVQRRASMLALARSALTDRRIRPHYQPKVNLLTGEVIGFEALLRWQHPDRGPQLPATIAAAFEDPALAAEISDRMIDCVIADARRWRDSGLDFGHVAVNAAAAEFRRGDFAESLLARLSAAALPVEALQLEVTESVFVGRGAECVERALARLSEAGMQIALDDFGTGYASLSHLQQFPVGAIKIDQSFVQGLGTRGGNQAIIDAVLGLGRSLGIDVVAEGIETAAQEQALLRLRCQYGQGYLYGRALPAAQVPELLRARRSARAAA